MYPLLVTILLLALTYKWFHLPISRDSYQFTPDGFKRSNYEIKQLMHYSKYKFLLSDKFEANVGGWDVFGAKPKEEKCEEFFDFITKEIPEWKASLFKNRLYNKNVVKKSNYFADNEKLLIQQKKPEPDIDPQVLTIQDKIELESWHADALNKTIQTEQEMADTMCIIRNFGHCFLGVNDGKSEKLGRIFEEYAPRILPYFAKNFPEVSSWVGYNSFFQGSPSFDKNSEFIDYYFNNIRGLGIVISASTRHVKDIVKLIHILRAMGNELPIQVLHRADILSSASQALEEAARAPKDELLSKEHMEMHTLNLSLKLFGLDPKRMHELEFPSQNLTLVNMHKPLSLMARSEFSGYNNKIAALFFNSFEKVILLDADTVPLQLPEAFFKMQEYINTGAYFFRDRSLLDKNDWVETNYFAKLMPHESSRLDMAMGVPPVSNHTMRNEYMKGWRHCQEAGVVVLDRKAHFLSLLVLLTLSLWGEPAKSSVWGDKELYWLAMSIAGDESYVFNSHSAASVGEFTSSSAMKQYNSTKSLELCSSHPGHISAKGELLWINSGFSYCKMNSYMRDRSKFPFFLFESQSDVKRLYESPLRIRNAIVPPLLPAMRAPSGPADQRSEEMFIESLKRRKKDVDELKTVNQIGDYGPQKGWVKSPLCGDYQYCAYNEINSIDGSESTEMGQVFTFEPNATTSFDVLGAIWISAKRFSSREEKYKNKPMPKPAQAPDKKETTRNDGDDALNSSKVRERPEKLNNDIKGLLAKLQVTSEEATETKPPLFLS